MDKIELEAAMVAHRLLGVAHRALIERRRAAGRLMVQAAAAVLGLEGSGGGAGGAGVLEFEAGQCVALEAVLGEGVGFDCDALAGLVQDVLNGLGARIVNAREDGA